MSESADFLPPDGMTIDAAGVSLSDSLAVRERDSGESDRTYYDTFDGLVCGAGMSAVHEEGRLVLVERATGAEVAARAMPQPTQPLLARELDDGPLRTALMALVDIRALLPLVHVHSRARAFDVLDDQRKTVVRMAIEEPVAVSPGNREVPLRPRVRLALVRGYDRELESVRCKLEHELGFKPADQPVVDEAVRATGGIPSGIPSKVAVPLSRSQRADAAAVAVLRRLLEVIDANLEGAIADIDSEFLHDFRVSVRRTRAVQRQLKRVFPPSELDRFRTEFRWLQRATGDSRDLDVHVLQFDSLRALAPERMRGDLDPLLGVLEGRRLTARREMVRALRSERTTQLLRDWGAFLEELVDLPTDERPDAARPIAEVSGARIRKVYRRMVKTGRAIDRTSPPEDYHELRKKGKELRYLLELFGNPLYPAEVVKPMIKTLKALQDVLGRHQDREVQLATVSSLRDEVSARPGGPAALMAMGVLMLRLGEDEQAARDEFASRFDAFAAKSQRRLVRDTFA